MEVKLRSKMSHWPKIPRRYDGRTWYFAKLYTSIEKLARTNPTVPIESGAPAAIEAGKSLSWSLPPVDDTTPIFLHSFSN